MLPLATRGLQGHPHTSTLVGLHEHTAPGIVQRFVRLLSAVQIPTSSSDATYPAKNLPKPEHHTSQPPQPPPHVAQKTSSGIFHRTGTPPILHEKKETEELHRKSKETTWKTWKTSRTNASLSTRNTHALLSKLFKMAGFLAIIGGLGACK